MTQLTDGRACPAWCIRTHGAHSGEEDLLHTSGVLRVRSTVLRLCASTDPGTGVVDGPYVLVGPGTHRDDAVEYTLHEAEALLGALTQLVDQGWGAARVEDGTGSVSPRGGA